MTSTWIWVFLLFAAPVAASAEEQLRFNRDVRPILSEKCFQCHGPDKNTRFANMRLDLREVAVERGVIVPGDPGASKMVMRIHAEKTAVRMPPVWSNKTLSDEERQTLVRWIEQGASYETHWAYLKPVRPDAPAGPAGIDFLVDKRLEAAGLEPAGEADRRTLIRRLNFDLTGLPPNPKRVDAFVESQDPHAYEALVDELLGSPHFGERMAVWWLDLVRYADTVGFHSDVPVSASPYRDYVIAAFHENKPFDVFTREQIAGDLLPNATLEQQVASAYNRLARMTNEGGAQAKEYLLKYAADRVRTTSTTWLGSTLGCAECHDHKFDPFLTKDFYQMSAFFADLDEKGVYAGNARFGPAVRVPRQEDRGELAQIEESLAQMTHSAGVPDADEFVRYWQQVSEAWNPAEVRRAESAEDLEFRFLPDGSLEAFGEEPREDLHQIEIDVGDDPVTAVMVEVLPKEGGPLQTEKWEQDGFHLSKASAWWVKERSAPSLLPVRLTLAGFETPPSNLARHTRDDNDHSGWGAGGKDQPESGRIALLFDRPVRNGSLWLQLKYKGRVARRIGGRYRVFVTGSAEPELPPEGEFAATLQKPESAALARYVKRLTGGNANWREIRRLERRHKELMDRGTDCVVSKSTDRREVRVLPRGNWMDDSGELVQPQSVGFLGEIPLNGRTATRVDLARWLVSRDNPLTARVLVNRLWKMYFGTGITKTLDDLGSQGEPPVNHELLDWLAVEFMDSGWDIKHVVRTLLLTETYRRSSEASEQLKAADPYNRLHGRQSAQRLDAEFIRDNALAVSGLLNAKIGGPSAKPYQPAGYYKELNFPKRTYQPDLDDGQYRRGLYTHWQRTFLHPALLAFDAPSREECTAERAVSNTPLQSLTLLNDPSFVEAARAFAARILAAGGMSFDSRAGFAFREAFSRAPVAEEIAVLEEFHGQQVEEFRRSPGNAERLLEVGLQPVPGGWDTAELAAWTSVARALFNKHEFLMRY